MIAGIENGAVTLTNKTTGCVIPLRCDISARQAQIIRAGGLLNYTREKTGKHRHFRAAPPFAACAATKNKRQRRHANWKTSLLQKKNSAR